MNLNDCVCAAVGLGGRHAEGRDGGALGIEGDGCSLEGRVGRSQRERSWASVIKRHWPSDRSIHKLTHAHNYVVYLVPASSLPAIWLLTPAFPTA
jgi:hypothetical protein